MKPGFAKTASFSNRPKTNVAPAVEKTTGSKPQAVARKGATLVQIQEKAYEIFLKRNGGPGNAESDWLEAERILKGV